MKPLLSLALALLFAVPALAEHPYDSACQVRVGSSGGTGTLIGLKDGKALVLTVKHVAERKGQRAVCNWGSQKMSGQVVAVHRKADIALLVVDAPEGIKPVAVAKAVPENAPFVMAGFPGYDRNTLRWQQGNFEDEDYSYLVITCRPEEGMSGGPTFDKYGRVVGAVSAYSKTSGYAGDGDALVELLDAYLE